MCFVNVVFNGGGGGVCDYCWLKCEAGMSFLNLCKEWRVVMKCFVCEGQ